MLLTWLIARRHEGEILLRIDDMDSQRVRTAYLDDIFQSLEWLGLDYDEGPSGTEDFLQHHSQLTRLPLYHSHLATLQENEAIFGCTCSRSAIRKLSPGGRYPGTCLQQGKPLSAAKTAWRLNTEPFVTVGFLGIEGQHRAGLHEKMPFFVVRKKDGKPAYQLCSVADDVHFRINFIVRGADLVDSTAAQVALSQTMRQEAFQQTVFLHHPLLVTAKGEKLSKSEGATSLQFMRQQGLRQAAFFRKVAEVLQVGNPKVDSPNALLAEWQNIQFPQQPFHWDGM